MIMQWNALLPVWLTLLLTGALLIALIHGAITLLRKRVAQRWVGVLTILRLAIVVVFVLILLQPAVTYTSSVPQLPELVIAIDTSSSMGRASGSGSETRLEEVAAALQRGSFAEALKNRYRLHWFAIDSTATPLARADIASLKSSDRAAQFGSSIDAACSHLRALGSEPPQLLLVSDGNDRGDGDPVDAARRCGLIVDVLAPTAQRSIQNTEVAIVAVQCARRVLLGSETIFRVTVNGGQAASHDRELALRVTEDGKGILEHSVVLKAGRAEHVLQLTHRPTGAGLKQYEFYLSAGKAASGQPYPLAVQVLDSKYEVLILEDRWRWEYKYLHRLFEDDPSFRFTALLARGGGAFVQFGSPDRRVNLVGFPQGRADLESFDTFVIGDVNPSLWPRGVAAELARQVADDGKSLVVVAGPSLANLRDIPELHAILPVELTPESGKPVEGPIEVRLRGEGVTSPFFFQLRGGDAEILPPLDQIYPVLRKRPGATVLLEAVKERNPYGNLIVIAEHTVGRGRVLFVGTDTLWKWHTLAANNEGPTPYSTFWQQAFRAMTPGRSNVGAVNLWLTPSRSRVEVGRPVVVQAEVQSNRLLSALELEAALTLPDDRRLPLVFTADPANPRLLHTEFSCQQPGLHRISASFQTEGKVRAEASTIVQADPAPQDRGDAGIDLVGLARIAQTTGGNVVDTVRPETWPMPPEGELPRVQVTRTLDLWNNFTLLVVLCLLLATDWFIRLFKGLVSG